MASVVSACGCSSSGSGTPASGGANGSGGSAAGSGGARIDGSGGAFFGTGGANPTGSGGAVEGSGGAQTGGTVGTGGTGAGTGGVSASGGGGAVDAGVFPDAASGGAAGQAAGGRQGGSGGQAGQQGQGGQGGRGGTAGNLRAAMVVQASGVATAGDVVMRGRLTARGFQVTLFGDGAVTAAAVASMNLIVISSSAESTPLGTKLRDVAVPILCIENGQYRNQGMTGTSLNTDYGEAMLQNAVTILPGASALVGDLTGNVTISRTPSFLGWGAPAASAIKGATQVGSAGHLAIFGYEKGAQMVGMTAPARRAGFAIREVLAANLNADGIKLFDSVLEWVLQ